eukprot:675618-Amphidinium_carterae.2
MLESENGTSIRTFCNGALKVNLKHFTFLSSWCTFLTTCVWELWNVALGTSERSSFPLNGASGRATSVDSTAPHAPDPISTHSLEHVSFAPSVVNGQSLQAARRRKSDKR